MLLPTSFNFLLPSIHFLSSACGSSVTSDLSTRSSASLYEEQFEDYGAGEEPDYTPSSPSAEDESRTHIYSDLGSSVPSRWERETHFYVHYGFESV